MCPMLSSVQSFDGTSLSIVSIRVLIETLIRLHNLSHISWPAALLKTAHSHGIRAFRGACLRFPVYSSGSGLYTKLRISYRWSFHSLDSFASPISMGKSRSDFSLSPGRCHVTSSTSSHQRCYPRGVEECTPSTLGTTFRKLEKS